MQSELPAALNVFDTEYQLENSESYPGTVQQEIAIEGYQYCTLYEEPLSRSDLKATPISYLQLGVVISIEIVASYIWHYLPPEKGLHIT